MNRVIIVIIIIMTTITLTIPMVAADVQRIQKIGHWPWGPCWDLFVNNNYLFMSSGCSVWVFDVSDPHNPVKISEIDLEGFVTSLYVENNYLYVSSGDNLYIIDISDIKNPTIVSISPYHGFIRVHGKYAYVSGSGKFWILDVSNPYSPKEIGSLETSGGRFRVVGNYVYLATGKDFEIIDVSDPTCPKIVSSLPKKSRFRISDVDVKGNIAYIVEYKAGIRAIDVSDPANPVEVGFIGDYNNTWKFPAVKIWIDGNYAYVSTRYEGFRIVNISDPKNMKIVSKGFNATLAGYQEGIMEYNGYVYVVSYAVGLGIWNVSDPKHPKFIKMIWTPGRSFGVSMKDHYIYVGDDRGFNILDVSDLAYPRFIKHIPGARGGAPIIRESIAYRCQGWGPLLIFDVSDPANPVKIGEFSHHISIFKFEDNVAYATQCAVKINGTWGGKFLILDVSNPRNITVIGEFNISARPYSSGAILGNYAYIGLFKKPILILNISNPKNITKVGEIPLKDASIIIPINNTLMYVKAGYNLAILDTSNPANPKLIKTIAFPPNVHTRGIKLWKERNKLFVGGDHIVVYNISDPINPVLEKIYNENAYSFYFIPNSNIFFAAAHDNGVYVFRYGEPDTTPPKISNVTITPDVFSVKIEWDTNELADSLIKYGTKPGVYDKQIYDSKKVKHHSVTIKNLKQNTKYYFVIISKDLVGNEAKSEEYSFKTLPDVTPPNITIVYPEQNAKIIGGTKEITVKILTDELAYCQYAFHDFEYGEGINFTHGQGSKVHSFNLSLEDGKTYTLYYRCMDKYGNVNPECVVNKFSVLAKWWDYFENERKIELKQDIEIKDGKAMIKFPDNRVYPTKDARISPISRWSSGTKDLIVGNHDRYRTIMEFTLPNGSGEIGRITLNLYATSTSNQNYNHTIELYLLNDTFDEYNCNWTYKNEHEKWNKPGGDYGILIDHYNATGNLAGKWVTFTVKGKDADNSLDWLIWGKTVRFILIQKVYGDWHNKYREDHFASRESEENKPYLEIVLRSFKAEFISKPITPTKITSWGRFYANYSAPEGTKIIFSILDAETGKVLCTNLTGKGDDVSAALAGVRSIKLKAELITNDPPKTPVLYDWCITWKTNESAVNDTTPPKIFNVTVEVSKTSARIRWQTDELSDSLVKYGTQPGNYTMQAYSQTYTINHVIELNGLKPNTTYYFVVVSKDPSGNIAQSDEYSFTTLGNETGDVTPPTTTYKITPEPNERGWINVTPVTVTFFRSDGCGVAYTNYSTDSKNWKKVEGDEPFNVTVYNTTTIWFYSVDVNGNVEAVKSVTIKIDCNPPTIYDINVFTCMNSAVISWKTNESTVGTVKYGTEPGNYDHQVCDSNFAMHHSVRLTNLTEGTYYFVIVSEDEAGNRAQSDEMNFTIETKLSGANLVFNPCMRIIKLDSTKDVTLKLDNAPTGLSGYNITISVKDPNIAEIESVEFPSWATLHDNSSLPSSTLWIKAVDLNDNVKSNAKNVELVTLRIKGKSIGRTKLVITSYSIDDDDGNPIAVNTTECRIFVVPLPPLPGCCDPPTDPDGDGIYEDLNGNVKIDFDDVVKYFKYVEWMRSHYASKKNFVDINKNGKIDFDDIVELFKEVS